MLLKQALLELVECLLEGRAKLETGVEVSNQGVFLVGGPLGLRGDGF